jgi:hypothetical protein
MYAQVERNQKCSIKRSLYNPKRRADISLRPLGVKGLKK